MTLLLPLTCNYPLSVKLTQLTLGLRTAVAETMAHKQSDDHGVMVAAMALRVKYRKVDDNGRAIKQMLPIGQTGPHPANRGGVYASGDRVVGLCKDVLQAGFCKEEIDHGCVAVEAMPLVVATELAQELAQDPNKAKPIDGLAYNKKESCKDPILESCFKPPHDAVCHMLLSHNHICLVLRAFLTQAAWNIKVVDPGAKKDKKAEEGLSFPICDDKGRLSITAVAEHKNGEQLLQALQEGFSAEILSYKMDVEEPTAAAIISTALNTSHQLALRTTELQAVQVLKGEIIRQGAVSSREACFESVKAKVGQALGDAAGDPDLVDLFDYMVSLGVGTNTYLDNLLDFARFFVNSQKRQLRFSAFTAANKIPKSCPRIRVGLIKRAYKKNPSNNFCPNPEELWGKCDEAHLEELEMFLDFIHVECVDVLDKLTPKQRSKVVSEFDNRATDAFYVQKSQKRNIEKIREEILEATADLAKELQIMDRKTSRAEYAWIDFTKLAEPASAVAAPKQDEDKAEQRSARIITFDEKSHNQLSHEEILPEKNDKQKVTRTPLPWKEWLQKSASKGQEEADKYSAITSLHALFESFDPADAPVDVWDEDGGKKTVTASAVAAEKTISIPPMIPKTSMVFGKSEHPNAAIIKQKVMQKPSEAAANLRSPQEAQDSTPPILTALTKGSTKGSKKPEAPAKEDLTKQIVLRTNTYYAKPEWLGPKKADGAQAATPAAAPASGSAAADAPASVSAVAAAPDSGAPLVQWQWQGSETMIPYWAIRRLTEKDMQKEQADWKKESGKPKPCFNCTTVVELVTDSVLGYNASNRTRVIEVPFVTNFKALEAGEELFLKIEPKEPKAKASAPKRTWVVEFKENQEKAKKARES